MAELKTKPTQASVAKFLNSIPHEGRRRDCLTILELMRKATGAEPKMWGPSIVGFGQYHYVYESGREGDSPLTGFSPGKQHLTLYVGGGFGRYDALLEKLGKYKTGKVCLYINKLQDVHLPTLRKLIQQSVRTMRTVNR